MSNDTKKPKPNTMKKLTLTEALDAVRTSKQALGNNLDVGLVRGTLVTRDTGTGAWTLVGDISDVHPGKLDAGITEIVQSGPPKVARRGDIPPALAEVLGEIKKIVGDRADVRVIAAPSEKAKDIMAALERGEEPEGGLELPEELLQALMGGATGGGVPDADDLLALDAMLDAAGVPPDEDGDAGDSAAGDAGDDGDDGGGRHNADDPFGADGDVDMSAPVSGGLAVQLTQIAHWLIANTLHGDTSVAHIPAVATPDRHVCNERCFREAEGIIERLAERMMQDPKQSWLHDVSTMPRIPGMGDAAQMARSVGLPLGLLTWISMNVRGGAGACNCAKCLWMRMLGDDFIELSPDGKRVVGVYRSPQGILRALAVFTMVAKFGPERDGPCHRGDATWESAVGKIVPEHVRAGMLALDAAREHARAAARVTGDSISDTHATAASMLQRAPKGVQ
jgi:hypothetical protein